jgi:hypothetical protein
MLVALQLQSGAIQVQKGYQNMEDPDSMDENDSIYMARWTLFHLVQVDTVTSNL